MSTPAAYELVIRGRASGRLLRPFLDGFSIDHSVAGVTRLVGPVTDPAHLHGLLGHLASLGAELVSVAAVPGDHLSSTTGTPSC